MRDEADPPFRLPEAFEAWFAGRGWAPRAHQLAVAQAASRGESALLIAPTGGGKTLAGFLPSLVDLAATVEAHAAYGEAKARPHRLHTLYISPLKALTADVARNLETPVREMGLNVRVETRTGDTPPSKRQRQRAAPPDILLTTPEQIALILAQENAAAFFEDLQAVIVDEIHAIAPNKRGDLLSLGLATLRHWAPSHRRIGLSATVAEPDALAAWLGPDTRILRGGEGAQARIDVLTSKERIPWAGHTGKHAYQEVYAQIKTAKTALVFVNTRSQAEMTFQGLWDANDDNLPIALHHGSLSTEQRKKVESAMTAGKLKAVVCTATLDLGIDWGDVDLVIQMGAPKGSSRLVQRIGRANHRLDEPSHALLVPGNRFEVLECRAAVDAVKALDLDGQPLREGALDVLCQHVMGRACGEPIDALALYEEIRAAAPYAGLEWETFEKVLDFVATGGYALRTYDRYKRIVKSPDGLWRARNKQVIQRHRLNVGAIVEDPMLDVRMVGGRRVSDAPMRSGPLAPRNVKMPRSKAALASSDAPPKAGQPRPRQAKMGKKIGRVEEWYVNQLSPGDTFIFAGQILRFEGMSETDVLVSPSPDPEPKIPTWQGGKFPLSTFLAKRVRAMIYDPSTWDALPDQVRAWLEAQRAASVIPEPDELLVETFPRGGKHYLVAYPFDGRLAHNTLGMLLTRRLERAGLRPMGFVANDYALSVWGLRSMDGCDMDALFHQDMLGDDLDAWLQESNLMKRTFRNAALISGLLERRQPGLEKTGRQVTFSTDLIYDVLRKHQPDHIILEAAWRDAGAGLLDITRLSDGLARIAGKIRHHHLKKVSPLSVPIMLEIGREPIYGEASEDLLEEAADDLIAEAMG